MKYRFTAIRTDAEYDYKTVTKERLKTSSRKVKDDAYQPAIVDELRNHPLNTAANVARAIKYQPEIRKFMYADGTHTEYTRQYMKSMFGSKSNDYDFNSKERKGCIRDKVWCRPNPDGVGYEPMSDEMVQSFKDLMKEEFSYREDDIAEICEEYEQGEITKKERDAEIGGLAYQYFANAKKIFSNKYGFYPIKVPYYEIWN